MISSTEGSIGQSVNQPEGTVTLTQGSRIALTCSYEVGSAVQAYPYWYIQHPGQAPSLFLQEWGTADADQGLRQNFTAVHNKARKTFNMEKASSQLSDSAVYFCAVRDTVVLSRREAGQKRASGKETGRSGSFQNTFRHSGCSPVTLPWK